MKKAVTLSSIDGVELSGIFEISGNNNPTVLFLHGICSEKNEAGFYEEISSLLLAKGFNTFRFDFRGHGESAGDSLKVSLKGMLCDLKTVLAFLELQKPSGISLIAASFGASIYLLYSKEKKDTFKSVVLLNPVLDYRATFLSPEVDWGKEFFNENGFDFLKKHGYIKVPETSFKMSAFFIDEMRNNFPLEELKNLTVPILMIHGDEDTMVPYRVTQQASKTLNDKSKFITINGADHGFEEPQERNYVIQETCSWILENHNR